MRSRCAVEGRSLLAALATAARATVALATAVLACAACLLWAPGGAAQASPSPVATQAQEQAQEPAQARLHRIHVVRHGWHAGIVVRVADVPTHAWPARSTRMSPGWTSPPPSAVGGPAPGSRAAQATSSTCG
jgi:hypothetical protein